MVGAVARWSGELGSGLSVRWEPVVTGRAALLGLERRGQASANGSCQLLEARDGWVAVNLPRDDDWTAMGVLLFGSSDAPTWEDVAGAVSRESAEELAGRARLLGIPVAPLRPPSIGVRPSVVHRCWPRTLRPVAGLSVVDLSAMWAGPLTARILSAAGAEVTKIESATRPDGARATPEFYDWLHPDGQAVVVVDLASHSGLQGLRSRLAAADVVIEASRPRALEQLGVGPSSMPPRPGKVWLSITGYGRDAPGGDWVAFGDDAAVAGGLVGWVDERTPVFCGDAIADPVTGILGAVEVLRALAMGGGSLIDLAMSRSAASLVDPAGWRCPGGPGAVRSASGGPWQVHSERSVIAVAPPQRPGAGAIAPG